MAKTIINKFEHSILLDDIYTEDIDTGTNEAYQHAAEGGENKFKISKSFGYDAPLIQINDYVFTGSKADIIAFNLDSSGFLPTCTVTLDATSTSFVSKSMPKDGDIMSVFLTSGYDEFNPIRNDFWITRVRSSSSGDPEGNEMVFFIEGELWIPRLDREICKSFNGTSSAAMSEMAKELNLGYSTNVTGTDDEQKWLATYDTYRDHINYVCKHSWNDDNSFYTCFIDVFYTLNFIEVNEQLKANTEFIPAVTTTVRPRGNFMGPTGFDEDTELLFTNYKDKEATNFYIQSFAVLNNGGIVNRNNGYIKDVKIFDFDNVTDETFTLESMITAGSEATKIIMKGRASENYYKDQKKTKFIGILFNGDEYQMHRNYHYAKIHNMVNNTELNKLNLKIVTNHMNFNIHRYQNIECAFIIQFNRERVNEMRLHDKQNQEPVLDNLYSGSYLIKELKIKYSPDYGFESDFILARREWPTPDDPTAHE
jgi:hypothetical protein